jgi:hypothetical protein
MSEPTNAQMAEQEDMRLDAQIADLMEARYYPEEAPDPDPPPLHPWYEDIDECVAFARWYWQGTFNYIGTAGEILDFFEKPWHFDEEYAGYKAENS